MRFCSSISCGLRQKSSRCASCSSATKRSVRVDVGLTCSILERGLRLPGVQVAERALQQCRSIAGRDLPAAPCQVGRFEVPQDVGAADRGTEPAVPQEVVVDPLAPDPAGGCNRVVRIRLQQVDVVSLLQVIQREHPVRQELVEKPQPPGVFPCRFRPDAGQEVVLRRLPEQAGEDRQVRPVVLQREFELPAQRVAGPVAGREDLLDASFTGNDPADSTRRHPRRVPVGDDVDAVPLDQGRVAGRPRRRCLPAGFDRGFARQSSDEADITITSGGSSRKMITTSAGSTIERCSCA